MQFQCLLVAVSTALVPALSGTLLAHTTTSRMEGPGSPQDTAYHLCTVKESVKLTKPSPRAGDHFGASVHLAKSAALFVGAPGDDAVGADGGAVYVYRRANYAWTLQALVLPSMSTGSQAFGWSLDEDRGTLAVGAPGDFGGVQPGAVHCFESNGHGGWSPTGVIMASTPEAGARFGTAVALDGDTMIVGAPFSSSTGAYKGNAYVFERDSSGQWHEIAELAPSALVVPSGAVFGTDVAVHDDAAIVGAPYLGQQFILGAAYFYRRQRGSWVQSQKVYGPLSVARDRFGTSVVLRGGRAYVGSPRDGVPPFGLVSHFSRSRVGWTGVSSQIGPKPSLVDRLGQSLAISRDRLVVTAPNQAGKGAGYLYSVSSGSPEILCELLASDGAPLDWLGGSSTIEGHTVALGAHLRDERAIDVGAVYVFLTP